MGCTTDSLARSRRKIQGFFSQTKSNAKKIKAKKNIGIVDPYRFVKDHFIFIQNENKKEIEADVFLKIINSYFKASLYREIYNNITVSKNKKCEKIALYFNENLEPIGYKTIK